MCNKQKFFVIETTGSNARELMTKKSLEDTLWGRNENEKRP